MDFWNKFILLAKRKMLSAVGPIREENSGYNASFMCHETINGPVPIFSRRLLN